jgi:hypothetical protein
MEAGAALADNQIGDVRVYDAGSLVFLNTGGSHSGVATLSTGSVTNVIAVVESNGGETLSIASYTASPTHSATLTRYTVTGHAKAPGGTLTQSGNNGFGQLEATLKPGLGSFWDTNVSSVGTTITDGLGTYSFKLFGGSWDLHAASLKSLPDSAPVAITVSADVPSQDVNISAGGVISGVIQDEAHNNLPGIHVSAVDSNHLTVGAGTTDVNGAYSMAVPFGTFEVFASGALTRDVSVSSGAATRTLNLTRFQVNGRLTDSSQAAVAGQVQWGGGQVTAAALGTYTATVMQGINWFLFTPPSTSPSLGFSTENNVLVDANTVKSLTQ